MESTTRVVTHGTVEGAGRKAIRNAKKSLKSEVTIESVKANRSARKARKRFDHNARAKLANTAIKQAGIVAATSAATGALASAMKAPYPLFDNEDQGDK